FVGAFAKDSGDVFDGKFHLAQAHDDAGFLDFGGVVEAVAGDVVHGTRDEDAAFVIEAQGLHGQAGDPGELADAVVRFHSAHSFKASSKGRVKGGFKVVLKIPFRRRSSPTGAAARQPGIIPFVDSTF